jgi:AcrR family transcriptional regulator
MSTISLESGRSNQKWRTYEALVRAAAQLIRQGATPSVAEVADAARVSRTTAYRYFPTQESLLQHGLLSMLVEADLHALAEVSASAGGPAQRLDAVVSGDHRMTVQAEPSFRAMLRGSLVGDIERDAPRRPGNRVVWLTNALSPLKDRLDEGEFSKLVAALSLCVGIESLVVLCDVCGLSREEAEAVKRWAAKSLLAQAMADAADASEGHRQP